MKKTENDNRPGGIIAVNKPAGITSHDVVYKMRKLFGTSRVGHTGTLDPLATGVLVVLIGRAAKACEYIAKDKKRYTATLRLGYETDTEDITGNVTVEHIPSDGAYPTEDDVRSAVESFVGKTVQIPPMYSALKVNGQKLCDLARRGIEVERIAREIEIYSVSVEKTDDKREFILSVHCSGGTYIRTLCADIGKKLGCGGVMASLRRDEANGIALSDAYTLDALEVMNEQERENALIPTSRIFEDYLCICLESFYEKLFRDGCRIYLKKLHIDLPSDAYVRVCDRDGGFFALGKVIDTAEGKAVKSCKIFDLKVTK